MDALINSLAKFAALGKSPAINSSNVKGEPWTGFEKAGDKGDFECGNCRWYADDSCGQADMMKHSSQPRLKNGRVKVADEDCCEYVDRVGRKEED